MLSIILIDNNTYGNAKKDKNCNYMILFIDFSHPILEENSQYTSIKTPKQKWCLQNIVISQILKIFFYFVKLFKILKYYYFSILINLILCT